MSEPIDESERNDETIEPKYALSFVNYFLFSVAVIIISLPALAMDNMTSRQVGDFVGRGVSCLLFPSMFGWLVWRLRGKKEKAGSWTFNIVLGLVFLGQLGEHSRRIDATRKLRESREQDEKLLLDLKGKQEELKNTLVNSNDPEAVDAATKKYGDTVKKGLEEIAETKSGKEKQFFTIMSGFISDSQAVAQKWNESFDAIQEPRILDYSLLVSDEEYAHQKGVIEIYIQNSKEYNSFFFNMLSELKKRLSVLGDDNEFVEGALSGASKKYNAQITIFKPLFEAHVEYGSTIIQFLDFLQKNKGEWVYENDEFTIESDDLSEEFDELIEKMGKYENTINTLSSRLVNEL